MKDNKQQVEVGQPVPDFKLEDADGAVHSLSDYRGQWVVLFFYPKDDTPGCTREACNFRNDSIYYEAANVVILGVNTDNAKRHKKFSAKYSLPFKLLIDEAGEVSRMHKSLFKLGPIQFSKRHTFIISPEGLVAKIYRSVSPSSHSREVLSDLELLKLMYPQPA